MTRTRIAFGLLLLAGSFVLGILSPRAVVAASPNHTKETTVEDLDIVVPAGESCSGEDVRVFGTLDVIIQTTTDSRGGLHVIAHFTPHLTGVGLTSGLDYLPVGPSQFVTVMDGAAPSVTAGVNIINLISPGSTDNLILSEMIHVTVNADGTVTVEFDNVKGGCRG